MKDLSLLVLVTLLLAACETVVDVEPPEHERQLVVNSLYRAGSPWVVEVSTSVGFLDVSAPATISNASVVLWTDGQPLDTLRYRPWPNEQPRYYDGGGVLQGYYYSDVSPQAGATYTLRVAAPGFEPVETEGSVPAVPAATFDVRTRSLPPGPHAPPEHQPTRVEVDAHLNDPADERNYYALHIFTTERRVADDSTEYVQHWFRGFELSDPLLEDDIFNENMLEGGENTSHWGRLFFSDRHINGRRHTLHLSATLDEYSNAPTQHYLVLEAISPDLYEYRRTKALFGDTDGNPFAEPVEVHSNLSNGFGIFAGASMVEVRLK